MTPKQQIKELKLHLATEETGKSGKPYLKCYTSNGNYLCFSESSFDNIKDKKGERVEYIVREYDDYKVIEGLVPCETREEAREKMEGRG